MVNKTHELLILPQYFKAVVDGTKTFELRRKSYNFSVGDRLKLCEVTSDGDRTDNYCFKKVSYVLDNVPQYGLSEDSVILGLHDDNTIITLGRGDLITYKSDSPISEIDLYSFRGWVYPKMRKASIVIFVDDNGERKELKNRY